MIKIKVGEYYKTRGGLRVGPMRRFDSDSFDSASHAHDKDLGGLWNVDGLRYFEENRGETDIVSLWHEPETPPSTVTAIGILSASRQHMEDRAATYDEPEGERSMAQTVEVFNLFHGTTLTEAQGWHFMQILKDVRLFTRDGYHADSAEDCVSYSALKAEAKSKEKVNV